LRAISSSALWNDGRKKLDQPVTCKREPFFCDGPRSVLVASGQRKRRNRDDFAQPANSLAIKKAPAGLLIDRPAGAR
jgi:hypothetical protein